MSENNLKHPIAIELTVPEYQLIEAKDNPDEGFFSNWFHDSNILGLEYCIGIFPQENEHGGEAGIYFQLECSKTIKIDIKVAIKTANFSYSLVERTSEKYHYASREKCCTFDELFDPGRRFIVGGKLTIRVDGFFMVEEDVVCDNTFECGNSSDSLCLALWGQEENKDFTVTAGEQSIGVHKCILIARSPVFAKMLTSGMKEAREKKVLIEDFSFDIVEKAIKLCYHPSLVSQASLEDKMKLLQFFDKYNIQQLKDDIETQLISLINELNVCRLTNACLLSNARELEEECAAFLKKCLKTRPIADFDALDKDFALNLLKNAFCQMFETS